jgi:alkyl hydroperoxide reductase subunit AhpF
MARTDSDESCGPHQSHQWGDDPIGAVPTPTGVISRSLSPKRRRSMGLKNADTLRFMPIFRADEETRVRELFDALERPVELLVAHGPEETPLPGAREVDFAAETQRVVEELAALSDRVTCRVEEEPEGFERYPAIAVLPEGADLGLRYYGLPWGYELGSLILGIVEAGKRESTLRPESLERLAALEQDLSIDVFVTPT